MNTIGHDELKRWLDSDEDVIVVEVLEPQYYRKFHLPGAINVPVGEDFETRIQEAVPEKDKAVVVYCLDRECQASPKAAQAMEELGYRRVFDYADGKVDWKDAGLPVES